MTRNKTSRYSSLILGLPAFFLLWGFSITNQNTTTTRRCLFIVLKIVENWSRDSELKNRGHLRQEITLSTSNSVMLPSGYQTWICLSRPSVPIHWLTLPIQWTQFKHFCYEICLDFCAKGTLWAHRDKRMYTSMFLSIRISAIATSIFDLLNFWNILYLCFSCPLCGSYAYLHSRS